MEISAFLKKEGNAWLSKDGIGQHGWEELPYWLKGFMICGYLLENQRMNRETQIWIEGFLNSQQPDGWFGPDKGRTGAATDLKGREDLWPNMIALFCLQSYYERSNDRRVLKLMTNYFKYLHSLPEEKLLLGYWPSMRGGDQLYSILWLYNHTGDAWLLELAHKTHRRTARWDRDVINWHNVNMAQAFRQPATYWQLSRNPQHLAATERDWTKIRNLYGQVPGGMYGADENARAGYNGPRQAIETCGSAEEMLSDEILIALTGNPVWAERCENVAFNTYPAAYTADYKALRYLTAPNQPQSDHVSKAPGVQNRGAMFAMNPHSHRCCQHNAGHAWPYFAEHLWYASAGNGLAALLYAPCVVTAKVADGLEVRIEEKTRYPFEDKVEFAFTLPRAARFPIFLRIPAWCDAARLTLNGRLLDVPLTAGQLVPVNREWHNGDLLTLDLPMKVRVQTWVGNRGFVSVQRGPLTYSLQIKEEYRRHGGTEKWPAYNIFPASPWNYGLVLTGDATKDFRAQPAPWPADNQPFRSETAPVRLTARARRIPNWTLDERGLIEEIVPSPVRSGEPIETVTLIPMGAARLRISAFPVIGAGPDARDWPGPKKPVLGPTDSEVIQNAPRSLRERGWGEGTSLLPLTPTLLPQGARGVPGRVSQYRFERLVIASHDKMQLNCYPCLARLEDGRLLLVWCHQVRTGGSIVGAFSGDHGRTWSAPATLIQTPNARDYDPSVVVCGKRVLVTSTTLPPGGGIRTSTTWCVRSDDSGATWSKPYAIPMNHQYTCGKTHCGLQLRSGTLLLGYSWDLLCEKGQTLQREGEMHLRAGVMISTDRGQTWRNGGDTDASYKKVSGGAIHGTDEPAIVELDDGSVYMLMRTGSDHLYQARSTDEGRSWTQIGPSPLRGSNAPAALCRFQVGTRRGILCVWDNGLTRFPLCAAASFDGCRTWSKPRDLAGPTDGKQASYPSCQQAADGTLMAVWQQDVAGGRDVRSARFDLDWLMKGE
jgi:predicted neuraminidase